MTKSSTRTITIVGLGTGRSSLGGVALGGTGRECLAMSEGTAAGVEELGVVLVLAVESIVASVVDGIRLEGDKKGQRNVHSNFD